ncbi:hypothetical protein D3C71_2181820 [compost metagenome]
MAVDLGVVALDETGFLERAHAPPARRGRQAHALRQFGVGQTRIGLELRKDGDIKFVQCVQNHSIKSKNLSENS